MAAALAASAALAAQRAACPMCRLPRRRGDSSRGRARSHPAPVPCTCTLHLLRADQEVVEEAALGLEASEVIEEAALGGGGAGLVGRWELPSEEGGEGAVVVWARPRG